MSGLTFRYLLIQVVLETRPYKTNVVVASAVAADDDDDDDAYINDVCRSRGSR